MITCSSQSRSNAKPAARPLRAAAKRAASSRQALPEWDLRDLYPAIGAPEVRRDLDRARTTAIAFETAYKGRLSELARAPDGGSRLAEAMKRLEALYDLLGRLMSFASLVHAGDTTDPGRTKFYGDVQDEITAVSLHLLFFSLELNRINNGVLEAAMADPELRHYRPFIDVVRLEKPYQLEDRVEQLFHEKSVTGYSAWNRLFDETIASLRFRVSGKTLPLEPTLNLMQDKDERIRKAAAGALADTFKQHLRTFTLITNTLAKDKEISDRWRGFADISDSRILPIYGRRIFPSFVVAADLPGHAPGGRPARIAARCPGWVAFSQLSSARFGGRETVAAAGSWPAPLTAGSPPQAPACCSSCQPGADRSGSGRIAENKSSVTQRMD